MDKVYIDFIKGYLSNYYNLKECNIERKFTLNGYRYEVRIVTELNTKVYYTKQCYDSTYIELICKDLIEKLNDVIIKEYRIKEASKQWKHLKQCYVIHQ